MTSYSVTRRSGFAMAGRRPGAQLIPAIHNEAVQAIAHAVKHGDVSPANALLERTSRPQREMLVSFLESYGPFVYMKQDRKFAYFKDCKALKEAGIAPGGELPQQYLDALLVSEPVESSVAPRRIRTNPVRPRKYLETDLQDLSDAELESLHKNADEGGDGRLARRCKQHLGARSLEKKRPDLFSLLKAAERRLEKVLSVIGEWPRAKLERSRSLMEGLPLPGDLDKARQVLVREISHVLTRSRNRRRGGSPVVQGGRADGNKPNRWEAKR